ncbi:hypothetical protein JVT61DRAFT_4044 [Boletus reticuloceps]|uniref:Uncharacterized protein n=1 Tax=Boletus reticuloceps TaxID=495285 RepID=A0A8I3A9L4_9AGAM|nr:hypothetical protein JVT61DRAFT_4044 [Boletus reticuloceps]
MHGLQQVLGWSSEQTPTLSDLHPSLANLDHVRRKIDDLRRKKYPCGTGFDGALLLQHEQESMAEPYVRCVEIHPLTGKKEFHLVICMSPSMAFRLLTTFRLSIDTSFKRLHGWEEFEIEAWDNDHMRSHVVARAFTTSQCADAHFILFQRIFEIAMADTGIPVAFKHIDGYGYESVIADAHRGQALGLGTYCTYLCWDIDKHDQYEPQRRLSSLGPYDHLKRFFRICETHFQRNAFAIKHYVGDRVWDAMMSLYTSDPHPDIQKTFEIIPAGGNKAKAWLKDKLDADQFALAAIYRPASFIPEDIWKASPSTTNGNEQSHRNINRDGINLTLLGGIMRGKEYDDRAAASIELHAAYSINRRDQCSTHARRASRSIAWHGKMPYDLSQGEADLSNT